VFVCENNGYMEYTPIGDVTAVAHPAADRAAAYGLESIVIDGNDADVVYATANRCYERARAGEGPSLVEALTYRHGGHSRADPAKYRPAGELEAWLERDPVVTYRARLLERGVQEAELAGIENEIRTAIEAAIAEASASPEPTEADLLTNVWSDGGSAWRS
jgi:TPP-dependent pyruvate/acetoin dehydrogenase alpha subunit